MTMAPQTGTAQDQTAPGQTAGTETAGPPAAGAPARAASRVLAEQIRVSVPERSLRLDLRAVSIVWRRELIRFRRDRLRAVTSLIQPLLFLLVLGTGLSSLAKGSLPPGVNFKTFIYPGVLAMSVMFTAIFSAASIVWDREFGFLREMLVAPVSRSAIVVGKCLGGATIATIQGVVMLALAWLADVPYNPVLLITLVGELLLLAFTLTAFGVMMAARITQFQAFMALTQMLVMPLFFLSGALYPLKGLPGWLSVLTRIDPLTYVVGPMRHAVVSHLNISPLAQRALSPGITWDGWTVPIWLSLVFILAMGLTMMSIAIVTFSKTE
jgi:daunorubicin resistance ABC transporter membrane protein